MKAHGPDLLSLPNNVVVHTGGEFISGSQRPVMGRIRMGDAPAWSAIEMTPIYDPGCGDISYPSTVALPDGWLYTVYYDSCNARIGATYMGRIQVASDGFSSTQGANNWEYEYGDQDLGQVLPTTMFGGSPSQWTAGITDLWIRAGSMHPGSKREAVRTWVAPKTGTITVASTVQKQASGGNGILPFIYNGSVGLWETLIDGPDTSAYAANVSSAHVEEGDRVYFGVSPRFQSAPPGQDALNDLTLWDPTVIFTATEG